MMKRNLFLSFCCILFVSNFLVYAAPSNVTLCKKGYKYGPPINADGQTVVQCDSEESCYDVTAQIISQNSLLGTSMTVKMNIGLCVSTSSCHDVTCSQIRRFMPSNMRGNLGSCRAKCCKQGVCLNVATGAAEPHLPPPSLPQPQRPIELPHQSSNTSSDVANPGLIMPPKTTSCKKGYKYGPPISADGQHDGYCDPDSSCHTTRAEFVSFGSVFGSSVRVEITIGQCVETHACNQVTCGQIRRFLPSNLNGYLGSCNAQCCKRGVCLDLPTYSGLPQLPPPTLPRPQRPIEFPTMSIGNALKTSEECDIPDLSTSGGYNIEGDGEGQTPKFQLYVKRLKKMRYKFGKTYRVVVQSKKRGMRFAAVYITLDSNSTNCNCLKSTNTTCPVGKLSSKRLSQRFVNHVQERCNRSLALNFRRRSPRQARAYWRAPLCQNATVIMRAAVYAADGRLYNDNVELDISKQYLTKVLQPAKRRIKKMRRRKRPKNMSIVRKSFPAAPGLRRRE